MLHIDSFFTQGKSHKICEDYAFHCNNELNLFAISDGCSSSKHTDFGSRLLSKSLEMCLTPNIVDLEDNDIAKCAIWHKSLDIAHILNMDNTCLDATLVYGYVRNESVYINMIGDGCFAVKHKNGIILFHDVEFSNNAPYYLSYHYDSERKRKFDELHQTKLVTDTLYFENGGTSQTCHSTDATESSQYSIKISDIESISIFSDGVKTLLAHNNQPKLPIGQIIRELTKFPVVNGEYVNRRCLKFIKTHADHSFFDDFSMATLFNEDTK